MLPARSGFFILFLFLDSLIQAQQITYTKDIRPLLEANCSSCHQGNNIGPIPLTTYEEVSAYGQMLHYVTSSRIMPPWYADASYSHFKNERILSDQEIHLISEWVEQGMPEGEKVQEHNSNKSPETFTKRKPDLIIPMREAFEQYGIYLEQNQVFVLPTNLLENKWIEGIEFVPGNKTIVRSANISIETSDKFKANDTWDPRYGYYSFGGLGLNPEQPFWYTWFPQQLPTFYPEGNAKFLPAQSKLIVQIQYGPTGKAQKDSSYVKLYFAENKIASPILNAPLINPYCLTNDSLFIPANTKKIFHASYILPQGIKIFSLTPQANLICRSWEIYAVVPGEKLPVKLLKIKDWNFNFKQTYVFEHPVSLPKGSVIHTLATYDNTSENPCNPSDKPVDIHWGAHVFSELFFVHFEYASSAIAENSMQIICSAVVSDSVLSLNLESKVKQQIELSLYTSENPLSIFKNKINLPVGETNIKLPLDHLKEGNYWLQVNDDNGRVIATRMLVKMKEGKM